MMRAISRRELTLRFGPSAALVWAVLRSSRATAQTVFPKRFVTLFSASGVLQRSFWPKGTPGQLSSGSYNVDGTSLEPLKPLLADVIIPKNIGLNRGRPTDAHDSGSVTILTGDWMKSQVYAVRPWAYGMSLDTFLAPRLSAGRPEPILRLGVRLRVNRISKYVSYDAQGQPLEPIQDPYSVYEKILKPLVNTCGGSTPSTELSQLRLRRKSVLDATRPQVAAMKAATGLGSEEQQKLEQMEESIRSVERRLDSTGTGAPPPTSNTNCLAVKKKMETDPKVALTDALYPQLLTLHLDLTALALQLDVTRVITLTMTLGGSGGPVMNWLKWNDNGTMRPLDGAHHATTHGARAGIENSGEKLKVIDKWNFAQFAYLCTALKNMKEGDKSVLDNSIVWYGTDCGEGSGHSITNLPFIVAGRAGGSLQTGRYLQYATEVNHQRLLLAFLHKLGFPEKSWGREGLSDGADII